MNQTACRTLLTLALSTFSWSSLAQAHAQAVYVLDDDGGAGVDFTSLQAALNVAGPLDRIDVRAGVYAQATAVRGTKVMGVEPGVEFSDLTLLGLPMDELFVLTDVNCVQLLVQLCDGAVIADTLVCGAARVEDSRDVRLQRVTTEALTIDRSFAQMIDGACVDGLPAAAVVRDSDVVFSGTVITGRAGFVLMPLCSGAAGDGADGLQVSGDSEVWLLRSPTSGGEGGLGCWFDGRPGNAIDLSDTSLLHRCKELPMAPINPPPGGTWPVLDYTAGVQVAPGASLLVRNDLASMRLSGGASVNSQAVFEAYAGVGTSARLFAGRAPVMTPFLRSIPLLHTAERGVSLGSMPPSEQLDIPFTIPPLDRGTLIFAQSSRTDGGGGTELSNSVVIVVR